MVFRLSDAFRSFEAIVPRTHQEIVRALATQRHHTAASSTTYDAGDKSEALRLATIICNIVHDAGRTRSILSLLGLKTKIVFMASGHEITEEIRRIVDRFTPLTELERYSKGGRDPEIVPVSTFFQNRGMHPFLRELPFEEWWQKDVILFKEGGNLARRELTRKRLVFKLRSQEGGSFFDSQVRDHDYLISSRSSPICRSRSWLR